MADAEAQAKAAVDAKAAADKAAAEAEAKAKEATEVQKAVAAELDQATKAAAPKAINVAVPSSVVTLKVTGSPIALNPPAAVTLKPGAKVELPIAIARKYDFADAVNLKSTVPGEAKGVSVTDAPIAAGQSEAKLTIEAAPDTAPGSYTLSVQATAKFNGQDLPVTQPLTVTVEAAGP
jgi:hypothetical protein